MSTDQHKYLCSKVGAARVHLKYICDKSLRKIGLSILDVQVEGMEKDTLISIMKSRKQKPLEDFLLAFINRSQDAPVIQAMAKLLSLLVGDAAMSAVLPFRFHKHILKTCGAIKNNLNVTKFLEEMKEYGIELSEILHISTLHNFGKECVNFVEYLIDEIITVYLNDKDTPPVTIMDQSYNPERGACYYFTPHGNQIRNKPKYIIDKVNKNYVTFQELMVSAKRNTLLCLMEDMGIYFFGFAQFMDTAMDFI